MMETAPLKFGKPENTRPNICNRYWNELKSRKLGFTAILVVVYAMAIDFSMDVGFNIAFAMSTDPDQDSCYAPIPQDTSILASQVPIVVQNILFFVAFPVMGWLADSVIGRGRAINLSLWLSWFGTLFQITSYCIQYSTCGLPVNIAKYGISSIALVFIVIGNAGFYSNMLSYGLDQMQEASSSQVRAFVHWLVWAMFVGFFTNYLAFLSETIYDPYFLQISAIVIFFIVTIVLCLSIIFKGKFEPSMTKKYGRDPYKTVYGVMKYAWNHKSPVRRSALTYWEEKMPSRIDLGKKRYGGPFDDEDPEDVKIFWRIIVVFLSLFGFYIPYYVVVNGIFPYINQMEGAMDVFGGYGALIIYKLFDQQGFYLIPIFELIIIPLFPKLEYFLTNPLRGLNVVYILLLIGLIAIFAIDTIGHLIMSQYLTCFDTTIPIALSFGYYAIPLFFTGLADFFSYLFALEFICSQAPVNMGGMLLGAFWLIRAFYLNIGAVLQLIFYFPLAAPGKLTCSFWNLLIQVIICIFGVIVNFMVTKMYKRRRRGDEYHHVDVITSHVSKILNRKHANINSMSTTSFEIEDSYVAISYT